MAKVIKVPPKDRKYHYTCKCEAVIEFDSDDVEKERIHADAHNDEHDWEYVLCPLCYERYGWEEVQRYGEEVNE